MCVFFFIFAHDIKSVLEKVNEIVLNLECIKLEKRDRDLAKLKRSATVKKPKKPIKPTNRLRAYGFPMMSTRNRSFRQKSQRKPEKLTKSVRFFFFSL